MARKRKISKKRGDTINLIVKSNELVEAKYMFDIWETRFFHTLVSMIDKQDDDEREYRIWFKDVKKLFNIKSNQSYNLLREAARSLNRKPVYIGWMNDKFRRGREYNLFEFVDYLEEGQKGEGIGKQEYVDIKIHKQMRPFLLHVKKNFDPKLTRYTSYELRNIERLQPYAMRIYELFKQFEYKGFRELNIEDLKDRFLITNEYPRFSTLYQRVIIPSVKAINKHTDINIPIDQIKKIKAGRKVVALYFVIQTKTQQELAFMRGELPFPMPKKAKIADAIIEKELTYEELLFQEFEAVVVQSFGVTPSVFKKMLASKKYEKKEIEQAIRVTRRAKYNQEITKSTTGFFLKALKEGYTDIKEEAAKAQNQKKNAKTELKSAEAKLLKLKADFSAKINERIKVLTSQDNTITERAIQKIKDNPLMKVFLDNKELTLGRALLLEDYRQDEQLRLLVINNIVEIEKTSFADLMQDYNALIKKMNTQVKNLRKKME